MGKDTVAEAEQILLQRIDMCNPCAQSAIEGGLSGGKNEHDD